MKQNDVLNVSGHLEIWKIYDDGSEEKAFDDHNVITSGMGVGLGLLYAGSGSADITNFQIRYFQVGTRGDTVIDTYDVCQVSLVSALGQEHGVDDYKNSESPLAVVYHQLMDWDGAAKVDSEGSTGWYFGLLPDSTIKRVDLNSITYIIYLDRNSCNNLTLNEVGLFMQNPLGLGTPRSVLCAYRPYTDIVKTSDFSLVFKWTLNF